MKSQAILIFATLASLVITAATGSAQSIVDQWQYTLRRPGGDWQQPGFEAAGWKQGSGGFGTRDTPGARVGTTWATNSIWLRKTFALDAVPDHPALLVHHDEDAQIWLNGKRVANLKGFTTEYIVVPLEDADRAALRRGENLLAVHCRQTGGGQFIDVHLVDADNVPALPEPQRSTRPFISDLITEWGESVTPENAWTEYPRPQLKRDNWTNLNGLWDYAITARDQQEAPQNWDGQILVPFSLESKLGGVQRLLDPTETLWYRRTFTAPKSPEQRTILNFEAVDYRCEAFVNGRSVGSHTGGNTPFAFDITDALEEGENRLIVRVDDDTEEYQLRGKQTLNPRGIWYTQVSGIWQTVWLEQVPKVHARHVIIHTWLDGTVHVRVDAAGAEAAGAEAAGAEASNLKLQAVVRHGDEEVVRATGTGTELTLRVPDPQLWSPDSPTLYDLQLRVGDDAVQSYFGIREVGKVQDADGHWRFTLNGQPIFHWGPLDQGWWPDGLLTPPSDEGMLFDIQWLKQAGFNMIRKHIKVEPRRYYYHCDRLGMMVWQDQVSGGESRQKGWPEWTRLRPNPVDAVWPAEQHEQFMAELEEMIHHLESHPSIVVWVPFNEAWGQHQTVEVGKWTEQRDPSRLVNIASGGNFWPVGDIVDHHQYPHPGFPFDLNHNGRFDDYIKVIGEFGGHGYPVREHLWDADRRNWGYGDLPQTEAEYKQRYVQSLEMIHELQSRGIAAGVYTQTTDVEGEINGLMTYDRKVIKIPAKELATLHQRLFAE
ncbi:glycoside hydrolase family 2 protein [Roseimaritima sediminicola]|uniref:glycoside hydrolase family 2 protein n=1 Tax=Roseimaritima sediminicola TaxID=2662066 RepID=UPI00129851E1|nr:sugar-binding domain-containing protein [Roseimaritima sediminicola]